MIRHVELWATLDGVRSKWLHGGTKPEASIPATVTAAWSDANPPWAAGTTEDVITAEWPPGVRIDTIATSGGTFQERLDTANAGDGLRVIRVGSGVHHLSGFRLSGTSGSVNFAHGYYHGNMRGWLGTGAASSIIQQDSSMTAPQLAYLSSMTAAAFAPNKMMMALLQPVGEGATVYCGGVTFRAVDQPALTSVAADLVSKGIYTPQPAPHGGIEVGQGKRAVFSYCRFVGASHAMYAAPPFEHGGLTSQYSPSILIDHCEVDGRRATEVDPARPWRGGLVMGNNETLWEARDSWFHHCNLSRIAVNDENRATFGTYRFVRCKIDHVGNRNVDPALNGGATLGGSTNAVVAGFESVAGLVEFIDCDLSVDNPNVFGSVSQHIGFSSTGGRNPQGGRLRVVGGTFRNTAFPSIDGFLTIRVIPTTYWALDGYATTIDVRAVAGGPRKSPWVYTGTWPPVASQIAAAGVTPETHYIVRPKTT